SIFGIILGLLFSFNVNEIEGFIRVYSRELARTAFQADPSHPSWRGLWVAWGILLATLIPVIRTWTVFYKERRAAPWGWMAAALAGLVSSAWLTTTWVPGYVALDPFDPALGQNFQGVLALWVGGIWVAFMGAWRVLDRWRRRPSWIFFGFLGTLVFSAIGIAVFSCGMIVLAIAGLQPRDGWRGLELFPRQIYYLDRIPVYVDYNALGFIVAATLLISVVFSVYPALRAAKANPIEVMRDEA
ncbi:MAG TPA: hypothetical protein VEN81_11645, partial [Planctomycetota bacterium]|nr:hypothetical protein [Planctomycetota bacterium]